MTNTYTLEYSSGKAPIKLTEVIAANPNQPQIEQYTYSNGNLVKVENNYNSPPYSSTTYLSTTAPNPRYGLITGFPNTSTYSVNQVDPISAVDPKYNFVNTYDSNGLVIKQVQFTGQIGADNGYTYEYESY